MSQRSARLAAEAAAQRQTEKFNLDLKGAHSRYILKWHRCPAHSSAPDYMSSLVCITPTVCSIVTSSPLPRLALSRVGARRGNIFQELLPSANNRHVTHGKVRRVVSRIW